MQFKSYLDNCDITFPLAAGTKLLSGDEDAEPDFEAVRQVFEENGVIGLELIEDGKTVSLAKAGNKNDVWIPDSEIEALLATVAPISPDGTYAQLTTNDEEPESNRYRIIVAGDEVLLDYPSLTWDDPVEEARKYTRGRGLQHPKT